MMLHVLPHMMAYDPHSGDYGLGFFGNALESGAYYVDDPQLGPLCFLCNLQPLQSEAVPLGAGQSEAVQAAAPSGHGTGYRVQAAAPSGHGTGYRVQAAAPSGHGQQQLLPKDAFAIAIFLEPLGLYLTSECGTFAHLTMRTPLLRAPAPPAEPSQAKPSQATPHAQQRFLVAFAADAPCATLRLKLTKTAQARPGSAFAVTGGALVRGAYEITPAGAGEQTTVEVTFSQ